MSKNRLPINPIAVETGGTAILPPAFRVYDDAKAIKPGPNVLPWLATPCNSAATRVQPETFHAGPLTFEVQPDAIDVQRLSFEVQPLPIREHPPTIEAKHLARR